MQGSTRKLVVISCTGSLCIETFAHLVCVPSQHGCERMPVQRVVDAFHAVQERPCFDIVWPVIVAPFHFIGERPAALP